MNHIRTIQGAVEELHKQDPDCAITAYNVRLLITQNQIPYRKAGAKYLVAVEELEKYFGMRNMAVQECG